MRGAALEEIEPEPGSEGFRRIAPAPEGRRWRDLARHTPGVLLLLGRGGVVLELSAPLCGRPTDYWRGRPLADDLGPDEARPLARALAALEHGAAEQELELPLEAAGGEPRLYRFRLAKINGGGSSARSPALSAFVSDVTEQVAGEQALREREALLARRHKTAMLAYLAGGVAHDLNNLLTVIMGGADLLGEDPVHESDDSDLRAELTQIRRASARASEITRQLLAFSRREPSVPLVLNLSTCIRELGSLLARLLGPGIRLELSFVPEPWLVRLDPLHAEHVVTFLVLQARQAMPHGGVAWLSLRNTRVESFERRGGNMVGPGDYVELIVRDTGIGLSLAALERAFEPFFAAEHLPGSTDLTLPLVRHLVVHAFGHIWVESEAGRGTVFHVLLPRYDESRASAPPRHHLVEAAPARALPTTPKKRRNGPRSRR